jgi:hypothetical protein
MRDSGLLAAFDPDQAVALSREVGTGPGTAEDIGWVLTVPWIGDLVDLAPAHGGRAQVVEILPQLSAQAVPHDAREVHPLQIVRDDRVGSQVVSLWRCSAGSPPATAL